MSDNLIERLRTLKALEVHWEMLANEAADALEAKNKKIERLNIDLRDTTLVLEAHRQTHEANLKRIAELEAALREIVELAEPDQYDEWAGKIAKQALGEKE